MTRAASAAAHAEVTPTERTPLASHTNGPNFTPPFPSDLGIHWAFDKTSGIAMGRKGGESVFAACSEA
jgi:hypothetical protein